MHRLNPFIYTQTSLHKPPDTEGCTYRGTDKDLTRSWACFLFSGSRVTYIPAKERDSGRSNRHTYAYMYIYTYTYLPANGTRVSARRSTHVQREKARERDETGQTHRRVSREAGERSLRFSISLRVSPGLPKSSSEGRALKRQEN